MRVSQVLAVVFGLLSLVLGYKVLDLAVWNDDLGQGVEMARQSARDMMVYAEANSGCEITPQQLADMMNANPDDGDVPFAVVNSKDGTAEVIRGGFKARFAGGRLQSVGDVTYGEVRVCDGA